MIRFPLTRFSDVLSSRRQFGNRAGELSRRFTGQFHILFRQTRIIANSFAQASNYGIDSR
jgi:hypothetical protein